MSDLWIGLLLSIPIGIGINLATPALSRLLDRRFKRGAARRQAQRESFSQEAMAMARDPLSFYSYQLSAILRTAFVGALAGLASGLLAAAGQAINTIPHGGFGRYDISNLFFLAAQLSGLAGTLLVLTIARAALTMIQEVRRIRTDQPGPNMVPG